MLLDCIVYYMLLSLSICLLNTFILATWAVNHQTKKLPVGDTPEVKTNLPKFKTKINLEGHGGIRNGLCQLPRHINITIIVLIEFQMRLY